AAAVAALHGVHAVISEPRPEAWIGGQITISGSATGSAFVGYDIRVAPSHAPQPSDWTTIASRSEPVTTGQLALWDTDGLSGPYTILLDAGPDAQITVPVRIVQDPTAAVLAPQAGDTVRLLALIRGTAAAPGFQSFHLEAEGPRPSGAVFTIAESSAPVWNDTLALWRTDSLEAGTYRLTLTVATTTESLTDSLTVVVRAPFAPGWPVTLPAVAHFAIRSVNLDGVGDDEIICPTNSGLWVFRSDGTVYPGWPRGNGADLSTAPAVADLDHDGRFEILVAGPTRMHVFAFIGEAFEGWPRPFESIHEIYGGSLPTVGNLDGRGDLEIAAIDRGGRIRVWNANGTNYLPQNRPDFGTVDITNSHGNSLPTVTICDLNHDGRNELIVAGDDIHIFDGRTGDPFGDNPETQIASHLSVNGTAIGDFNDDGMREIAYAFGDADSPEFNFAVNLIDATGRSLSGWPRVLPQTVDLHLLYSIAAGDVDGDRIPEIFVAPYSLGEGFLYGFHADGAPVGSDSSDGLLALLPGSVSAIGLVDIDLDDQPEIIARVGEILSGPDWVYAIEVDGGVVPGYPITFGFGATYAPSAPIIGDLNHDGMADMVTVQSTDRVLTVWELGVPATPRARPWPQFRADRWNSGVIATPQYDLVHLMRIIDVIFRGGAPLPPYEPSDLDCDGVIDIADIIRLTDFLYRFGAAPCVP
ncbi:MAG TPA: VCBS repeat-containing protein, partial [Acidobacteriota bacterium]|nr:VCBS repeat-containing protein [Acidobacteriota bacterium]